MFKGCQFFKFIAPNIDFQHDILIFTDFGYITKQKIVFTLIEFLTSYYVSIILVDIFDFRLFLLLVIVIEILSCLIQTFEEVHHVTKPDVYFQLVYVFKNLCCFDFTIDIESDLRSVETQSFFVCQYDFLSSLLVSKNMEKFLIIYFCNAHDDKRNKFSKLSNTLPKTEKNSFFE